MDDIDLKDPHDREQAIFKSFEAKALAGDAGFAIAYAILNLSVEQREIGFALRKLGVADAATPMGALEYVGSELANIAEAISSSAGSDIPLACMADALDGIAKAINEKSEPQPNQKENGHARQRQRFD